MATRRMSEGRHTGFEDIEEMEAEMLMSPQATLNFDLEDSDVVVEAPTSPVLR